MAGYNTFAPINPAPKSKGSMGGLQAGGAPVRPSGGGAPKLPSFGLPRGGGSGSGGGGEPWANYSADTLKALGMSPQKIAEIKGSGGGSNLSTYAKKDPRVERAQNLLEQRYQDQMSKEGQMDPYLQESIDNLRQQMSSDQTGRVTNRALSTIRDQAAGLQQAADVRRAQTGQGGGATGKIAEAAQRAGAKAAADIQLAQQGRLDQLTLGGQGILSAPSQLNLARSGQNNALLGQLAGNADQGARLGLDQMRLGLDQWGLQNDANYKNRLLDQQLKLGGYDLAGKQMDLYGRYLQMLGMGGY